MHSKVLLFLAVGTSLVLSAPITPREEGIYSYYARRPPAVEKEEEKREEGIYSYYARRPAAVEKEEEKREEAS